ncbi:uncharacterized protein BDR25DRAFT_251226 [Lindgomyces ingoldianus]|uniref:Uncharacterized protein n=1 Tax=Lindgomyces ingoldianus TaxID=673940 RepID=A0ACB6RBZ7_9PLEO|nr:uncharacterized protein BDR25DRAFT_251226 [Lindgomyces ingoldianus]KAF2476839.1 hypothetical protein BDR25DRAFT_251226 [Lindgomyces ingoldianus]
MMPRPLLRQTFGLTYRKIPVLTIGRDIYCDTSLIIEALEYYFPEDAGFGTVYPRAKSLGGPGDGGKGVDWAYRSLVRGFASFWVDRPLFRTTTGLIPSTVWSTAFGADRSGLIGHKLDPEKLGAKIPENLSNLDLHLSLLEPMLKRRGEWVIPTATPSLADLSLYYQLRWGVDIAAGKGVYNLTAGGIGEGSVNGNVAEEVFNKERYPGVWDWFHAFEAYICTLPDPETVVDGNTLDWKDQLRSTPLLDTKDGTDILVPTPAGDYPSLDLQRGLQPGVVVSVAPDDTGRDDPTVGELVRIGVEEVVVRPVEKGEMDVRIHFPRLGFVVRVAEGSRL